MKSCLLVDGSRVIRRVARGIVENLSFTCSEAEDGNRALAACAEAMPDAILLGWILPGLSGVETLKAIRAMPGGDRPKIVLCTTSSEIGDIMQALDEGADECVVKPFDDGIIRSKFEQVGLI